jgi:hypothetical protein
MSGTVPNNVNVYQDTPNQVIISEDTPNLVIVRAASGAGNTRRHVYTQSVAATTWVVTHTLGGFPSVTVVDSAGTAVFGDVKYDSATQITITFTAAFSGFAYLT